MLVNRLMLSRCRNVIWISSRARRSVNTSTSSIDRSVWSTRVWSAPVQGVSASNGLLSWPFRVSISLTVIPSDAFDLSLCILEDKSHYPVWIPFHTKRKTWTCAKERDTHWSSLTSSSSDIFTSFTSERLIPCIAVSFKIQYACPINYKLFSSFYI